MQGILAGSQSVQKSMLRTYKLKVKVFFTGLNHFFYLRLVFIDFGIFRVRKLALEVLFLLQNVLALLLMMVIEKAAMFREYFSTVFEPDDCSEPVFHDSVSNVSSDVQYDVYNILCKANKRFIRTATPSVLEVSCSFHTRFANFFERECEQRFCL